MPRYAKLEVTVCTRPARVLCFSDLSVSVMLRMFQGSFRSTWAMHQAWPHLSDSSSWNFSALPSSRCSSVVGCCGVGWSLLLRLPSPFHHPWRDHCVTTGFGRINHCELWKDYSNHINHIHHINHYKRSLWTLVGDMGLISGRVKKRWEFAAKGRKVVQAPSNTWNMRKLPAGFYHLCS